MIVATQLQSNVSLSYSVTVRTMELVYETWTRTLWTIMDIIVFFVIVLLVLLGIIVKLICMGVVMIPVLHIRHVRLIVQLWDIYVEGVLLMDILLTVN